MIAENGQAEGECDEEDDQDIRRPTDEQPVERASLTGNRKDQIRHIQHDHQDSRETCSQDDPLDLLALCQAGGVPVAIDLCKQSSGQPTYQYYYIVSERYIVQNSIEEQTPDDPPNRDPA